MEEREETEMTRELEIPLDHEAFVAVRLYWTHEHKFLLESPPDLGRVRFRERVEGIFTGRWMVFTARAPFGRLILGEMIAYNDATNDAAARIV